MIVRQRQKVEDTMTFRKLTFLFIAILLSLLLLLQFIFIQNYTKDVSSKIGQAAFEVSRSTIETLIFKRPELQFKSLAISSHLSESTQIEIINSLSNLSNEFYITLKDEQKDKFLTIESAGAFHEIDIPRTGIEKSLDAMSEKLLMSTLTFIVIGLIAASYFSRRLSDPLKELQKASRSIGKGDFGFQVKEQKGYQSIELKNTISAFNEMSEKIAKLQSENEKLQKQAQLSELTEITRGLAHTIRNPLNTLNLAIDELDASPNNEAKKELVRVSKHQIRRIDNWVRSLMNLMSNNLDLVTKVNIKDLLESSLNDILLNNRTKVEIVLDVEPAAKGEKISFEILGIETELKGLLLSLISNSIEAFPDRDSGVSNRLTIGLSRLKSSVIVDIKDNGSGFNKEIKSKLFSPHNTNKTYGAGMGLYLAHRIISIKYNGNLEIMNGPFDSSSERPGAHIKLTINDRA